MAGGKEIEQADAKLREAGFDPAAAPEDALAALRSMRGRPGLSDAAVARALAGLRIAGAADLLAEMEGGASGAQRREIRRALFKLRQHGIAPGLRPASEPQPAPAPITDREPSALISPIDFEGNRMVWILKPRIRGGLTRLWGITSETEGLIAVNLNQAPRREVREDRDDLERRSGVKLVEADWRLADFILCEGYRRTPESIRGRVGTFLALRAELISAPPTADLVHPVYKELLAQPLEPSVELLKEPEIASWRLAPADIGRYAAELNELAQSPIVLNQLQQQDRINALIERAIDELISQERGERIRRRLEDTAYYLARTGRMEPARWAAAAALSIRERAELKRIAFFQGFIRAQLGAIVAEKKEREQEQPRLVVTPAEAMREREARARRR